MKTLYKRITALLCSLLFVFVVCACTHTASENPLPENPPFEEPNQPELPPAEEPDEPATEEPPQQEPAPPAEPEPPKPTSTSYVQSKVDSLNVRSSPSTAGKVLGQIEKGDMVVLLSEQNGWFVTQYKNKTAYLSSSTTYTAVRKLPLSADERIEATIAEGYKLLGFPYVYGATRLHDGNGKKISGFDRTKYDCSSLMQYIFYYGANVNLNMTTRTQIKQGKHVDKNDLSRGDLIFFTNDSRVNKTGIERVGHVALYLGGNYILHTASDYAVIEEISAKRWSYYIEARRMV